MIQGVGSAFGVAGISVTAFIGCTLFIPLGCITQPSCLFISCSVLAGSGIAFLTACLSATVLPAICSCTFTVGATGACVTVGVGTIGVAGVVGATGVVGAGQYDLSLASATLIP